MPAESGSNGEREHGEPPSDAIDELVDHLRRRALAGDPATIREYRLALQAQRAARAATVPVNPLATSSEWVATRTAVTDALRRHPEARAEVIDALGRLGVD